MLRLIEAGVPMRDFRWKTRSGDPGHEPRSVRRSRSHCPTADGFCAGVAERVLREGVGIRPTGEPGHSDRRSGARSLERTLRAVAEDKLALIDTEIDWAIKLKLLDRYSVKHKLSFADPRIAQLDLAYHDIRRSRGVFSFRGARPGSPRHDRSGNLPCQGGAAPDDEGQAPRRLHPCCAGGAPLLHRRLGTPEAE